MISIIEITIVTLGWFSLGFFLGYLNGSKKDIKEFVDETGRVIKIETKKLTNTTTKTGQIRHLTAQEVYKRNLNPERKEALAETKTTLDQIPDLVQARELAKAMRKEQYG